MLSMAQAAERLSGIFHQDDVIAIANLRNFLNLYWMT